MSEAEKAKLLQDTWAELEEDGCGEMAAYHIACEQLDIDPDDGWELLLLLDGSDE